MTNQEIKKDIEIEPQIAQVGERVRVNIVGTIKGISKTDLGLKYEIVADLPDTKWEFEKTRVSVYADALSKEV